jgi:DNA-directed RNA polymerase omega subunit
MKMSYLSIQPLLEKVDNIYQLVLLASQRTMELTNGTPKLVDASPKTKASTVALDEIRQGKISLKKSAEK